MNRLVIASRKNVLADIRGIVSQLEKEPSSILSTGHTLMHRTKNVLADIRDILSQLGRGAEPNFRPGSYKEAQNEERPRVIASRKNVVRDIRIIVSRLGRGPGLNFALGLYKDA